MTNIRVTEIKTQLIHLDFDHNTRMNKCLMRFQEYAENPKYKGIANFSARSVKRYYKSSTGNGRFDYYRRILGCNIPSSSFDSFYDGQFKYITPYEQEILEILPEYVDITKKYYVIATADKSSKKDSLKALEHEIAHGLWFIDPTYRSKCMTIMLESEMFNRFHQVVSKMGYHPDVFYDEIHAYVGTDNDSQFKRRFKLHKPEELKNAIITRDKLKKVFKEHYEKESQ